MTKPASAAATRRFSMISHGFRLFDREMTQKSWPSGAPILAATASMAVTPGTMDRSILRDRKSVVEGKSVSVRVDLGGRRILKKKKHELYRTYVSILLTH